MTNPTKRHLVFLPIVLSIAVFLTYGGIFLTYILQDSLSQLYEAAGEFIEGAGAQMVLLSLLLQSAFSAVSILLLYIFFRKTHSPEVFFFLYGLLGLTIQTTRFLIAPVSIYSLSAYSLIPFTRLVYFGKIVTVLSLFTSGLFATGFTNQRRNFYLSLIFLISFIISVSLPVDFTSVQGPLLLATGSNTGFSLAYYALCVFTLLNFALASYKHTEPNYIFVVFSILLVLSGIEVMFFFPYGLFTAAGIVLTAAGTVLFANRTHELYMWI